MTIDNTKCPYCGSPTVIKEYMEYEDEHEGIYSPYEVVITCTGIHKGKELDIADWYDASSDINKDITHKQNHGEQNIVSRRRIT